MRPKKGIKKDGREGRLLYVFLFAGICRRQQADPISKNYAAAAARLFSIRSSTKAKQLYTAN